MPLPVLLVAWVVVALMGALGVRLLAQAHRLRSLPELLIGLFFVGASVGYAPGLVLQTLPNPSDAAALLAIAYVGIRVPPMTIVLFTWRVFRPRSRWALVLVVGLEGSMLASSLAQGGPITGGQALPAAFWVFVTTSALALGWTAVEALWFYGVARRRVELGLGDALVTNRFLLWSIWSGGACIALLLKVIDTILKTGGPDFSPARTLIACASIAAGIATMGAMWLTFYPPRFYRRRFALPPEEPQDLK